MKNFSQKFFSQKIFITLFLGLFLGGCEVTPTPAAYLQYLLGNKQGVVTVDDISIIDGGTLTMRFTINDSKAISATVYTSDSTNTLAFTEGAYSTYSNGDYTYAIYEGSNTKLWLANFDNKGGVYKLSSNGSVIDEGNFVWWVGDVGRPFWYDLEEYSCVDNSIVHKDSKTTLSMSEDGDVTYHWAEINKKNIYFKVDADKKIYGVTYSGVYPNLRSFSQDEYTNLDVESIVCVLSSSSVYGTVTSTDTYMVLGNVYSNVYSSGDVYIFGTVYGNVYTDGNIYILIVKDNVSGAEYNGTVYGNLYDLDGNARKDNVYDGDLGYATILGYGEYGKDVDYIKNNFVDIARKLEYDTKPL